MTSISSNANGKSPAGSLPRSQRFLRMLPTPFLKLTNATFLGGMHRNSPKSSGKTRKGGDSTMASTMASTVTSPRPSMSRNGMASPYQSPFSPPRGGSIDRGGQQQSSPRLEDMAPMPTDQDMAAAVLFAGRRPETPRTQTTRPGTPSIRPSASMLTSQEPFDRLRQYDQCLTPAVWELATRKSNPAVDLVVCLERNYPIGFQYSDISRSVIIHHGSKDSRVPLENIKWLGARMRKADVRVVEGGGHGLMASAGVMGQVLTEMAQDRERGVSGSDHLEPSRHLSAGKGEPLL